MLKFYHYPLCPFSRKMRIILSEKNCEFELITEKYWERRDKFVMLNPSAKTPVLQFDDGQIVYGNYSIDYIEEIMPNPQLLANSPKSSLKIKQITEWFDDNFYNEVTKYILNEKIIKIVSCVNNTNSNNIRAAKKNLFNHLDYICYLLGDESYLCGERATLADYAAAAQISVLDFVNDMPWEHSSKVKSWYSLIKSRPIFKGILLDELPQISPPTHYQNPDF